MKGSLKIMHFGFLISIIVAVLIIGTSQVAIAQAQIVGSPSEYAYNAVPKTAECCNDPTEHAGPEYINVAFFQDDDADGGWAAWGMVESPGEPMIQIDQILIDENKVGSCTNRHSVQLDCKTPNIVVLNLTPQQVKASQRELLAYVTALDLRCDGDSKFLGFTPRTTVRMWKCRLQTSTTHYNNTNTNPQ